MNTKNTETFLSEQSIAQLKKELLLNRNALQTFVGGYVPTSLDKKVIEKVLNETIAEMPEEKLKSFYKEVKNKGEKK